MKERQAPEEKNSPPTIDSQACDVKFKESTTSSNLYNRPVLEFFLQQCKLQEIRNHLLLPCFFQVFLKHMQFKPWVGVVFLPQKKGHCWWREGRGRHLGQLLQSSESFRKICLESSERFIVVVVEVCCCKLLNSSLGEIMVEWIVVSGGFFSEHGCFFFLKTKNVMFIAVVGKFLESQFHCVILFCCWYGRTAFVNELVKQVKKKGRTEGGQYSHWSLLRLLAIFTRINHLSRPRNPISLLHSISSNCWSNLFLTFLLRWPLLLKRPSRISRRQSPKCRFLAERKGCRNFFFCGGFKFV